MGKKYYWETRDGRGDEVGPLMRKWIMEDEAKHAAQQQAKSANFPGGMSPDQAAEAAYRRIAQDRAALSDTNYPVYRGQTTAPMSTLTQRAQELKDRYAQKAAPYSKKLETVLNRGNEGFTPENIQGLLATLGDQQRSFGQGPMMDILKKQFLSSYAPREARFAQKNEKDIGRYIPETQGKLQNIGSAAAQLERSRNREGAKILQYMQKEKQARREGTIGALEQFGSQKHAHTNMVNQANRGQFEQEANEPYRKMQMLESSLAPHAASEGQELHPDLASSKATEIARAMQAYNTKLAPYPGQLVANLSPEIQQSHSMLERLNPSLKDDYTNKRKELTRGLVGPETPSQRALQNLTPAMQGQVSLLERQAQDRMKQDLGTLNNKYIRLRQYGSPQHIGEAERRMREINRGVLEARNKMLQDTLGQQLQLQHGNEIDNIKQLGQIGQQSHTDYGNILKNLSNLNRTGATKFANEQAENEDLYKNYQNEKAWQWPHMRGVAQNGGIGSNNNFAPIVPNSNLSVENLHNLNTSYSNIDKESGRQPFGINSMNQFHAENAGVPNQMAAQTGQSQQPYSQQAQSNRSAVALPFNPIQYEAKRVADQNEFAQEQQRIQQVVQATRQKFNLPHQSQYVQPRGVNATPPNQMATQTGQVSSPATFPRGYSPFPHEAAAHQQQLMQATLQKFNPPRYKHGGIVYR